MTRLAIWEKICKGVPLEEEGDYKTQAAEVSAWVEVRLLGRERLSGIFSDRPDGEACPRAFWAYSPEGKTWSHPLNS